MWWIWIIVGIVVIISILIFIKVFINIAHKKLSIEINAKIEQFENNATVKQWAKNIVTIIKSRDVYEPFTIKVRAGVTALSIFTPKKNDTYSYVKFNLPDLEFGEEDILTFVVCQKVAEILREQSVSFSYYYGLDSISRQEYDYKSKEYYYASDYKKEVIIDTKDAFKSEHIKGHYPFDGIFSFDAYSATGSW